MTNKQTIINFFRDVITGVRGEYEKGWSTRSIDKDVDTLHNLLDEFSKKSIKNKKSCPHNNIIYGEATLCDDCKELIDFQESL